MPKLNITIKAFDFSHKKVKAIYKDGSKETLDKFSVCSILKQINYYGYLFYYDVKTYNECVEALLDELESKQFENIEILY